MIRCCENCEYYSYDTWNNKATCTNPESDYVFQEVEYDDCCKEWG